MYIKDFITPRALADGIMHYIVPSVVFVPDLVTWPQKLMKEKASTDFILIDRKQ